MPVGYVASASSGSQANVGTFNIGTLGTGARAGIVFVATHNSATAKDTGVTWNGAAMSLLYSATDTDTEPGVVRAYFLDNVTNGVITVTRTNDAVVTVGYAASISASRATEIAQTITRVSSTQNTNANTSATGTGASGTVNVDDGSPGTDSMRFAAYYSGAATPPAANTGNSTGLQVLDSTAYGSRFVRETTAGQGSRPVGAATGTTDDWALVAVAVRETIAPITGTGPQGTQAKQTAAIAAKEAMRATAAGAGVASSAAVAAKETMAAALAGTGAASSGALTGAVTAATTGTITAAQAKQTAAISAAERYTGTASGAGAPSTAEIAAGQSFTGTLFSATGAASSAVLAAEERMVATLGATQAAQAGVLTGAVLNPVTGTLTAAQASATGAGAAKEAMLAMLAGSEAASTASLTGLIVIQGGLVATQAAQAAELAGVAANPIAGMMAGAQPAPSGALEGTVLAAVTGTLAATQARQSAALVGIGGEAVGAEQGGGVIRRTRPVIVIEQETMQGFIEARQDPPSGALTGRVNDDELVLRALVA